MLVNRRTFIVKKPFYQEAIALLIEARQITKSTQFSGAIRLYESDLGSFDTIVYETEHENFAAYERDWDMVFQNPAIADRLTAWFKRWNEITAAGGTNEIWRVIE